jgi:hypothetical protein
MSHIGIDLHGKESRVYLGDRSRGARWVRSWYLWR